MADKDLLTPVLYRSQELSCEFGFATLIEWSLADSPAYQFTDRALYLYLQAEDLMTFTTLPDREPPSAEELLQVDREMRRAGRRGGFCKLRREVVDSIPGAESRFAVEKEDRDQAEYLHEVDRLVRLPGRKLAKKRNLISQFVRDFPDRRIQDIDAGNYADCLDIAARWTQAQPDPRDPDIVHEHDAIRMMERYFPSLDSIGLVLYVGDVPAAFCTASPVSRSVYTESFEKALHQYKGAAQFLNHELALRLQGRCRYLNREQDMGRQGMRQAKLSYDPDLILESWRLLPR